MHARNSEPKQRDPPAELAANASLDVPDISRRMVLQRELNPGMPSLQIAVAGWADGVYCLRLNQGSRYRSARFVKH